MASSGITVLLGAGSVLDVCPELSTESLTNVITSFPTKKYPSNDIVLIERYKAIELINTINHYYDTNNKGRTFEDIFQFIIDMRSEKEIDEGKSVLHYQMPDFVNDYSSNDCENALCFILEKIFMNIRNTNNIDLPLWYSNFFTEISKWCREQIHLDCYTLNYDCFIDRALGVFNDGFIHKGYDYSVFKPKKARLSKSMTPILNHIHGSILFNYRPIEEESDDIIYKYDLATASPPSPIIIDTQIGKYAMFSPIITGLDKPNSIMIGPFSMYHANMIHSLARNDVLLIIGYGFHDNYLNSLIDSYHRQKGKKTVIVTPDANDFLSTGIIKEGIYHNHHYRRKGITVFKDSFKNACKNGLLDYVKSLLTIH